MKHFLIAVPVACLVLILPAGAAESVAQLGTTGDTVVVFPVGQWILALSNAFMEAFAPILVTALISYIGMKWPLLKSLISEKVVEDQVGKFVAYAENAEAGALKGAHLDVNVGQSVLATTVARAIESANVNKLASWAVKQAGGPEAIAKKAFRRLNLDHSASAENVLVPVLAKIQDGTLLPEKIAAVKIVPATPTNVVPTVTPTPLRKGPPASAKAVHR